jgi:UDP-N-acetylmuramoyl-tripeptide--D-alanyl-D-alanine ligase
LRVKDTLAALQSLAKAYRRALAADGTKVVAITGSSGKTSTRTLVHAALSAKLRGTQSPKSFNNHVGVPLTILAARPGDDFVVAEVGTNHLGEIAPLADLLEPDAAVITNIGSAHLGHFGTRDAIAREKSDLLRRIRPGGLAVLPAECDLLPLLLAAVPYGVGVSSFGSGEQADVRLTRRPAPKPDGLRFTVGDRLEIELKLLGEHNALNALAAVAVGRWLGLSDQEVARGLAEAALPEMRLQVLSFGPADEPVVVLNDAYNANPESMWAAVRTLLSYPLPPRGRRMAILGDMFELGDQSPRLHRDLLERVAAEEAVDQLLAIGPAMSVAGQDIVRVVVCGEWRDGLADELAAGLRGGDVVLLKGSRGMKMERLLAALARRFAAPAP